MKRNRPIITIGFACDPKTHAEIKAFCRMTDTSIGAFTRDAIQNKIGSDISSWDNTRLDRLRKLTEMFNRKT